MASHYKTQVILAPLAFPGSLKRSGKKSDHSFSGLWCEDMIGSLTGVEGFLGTLGPKQHHTPAGDSSPVPSV